MNDEQDDAEYGIGVAPGSEHKVHPVERRETRAKLLRDGWTPALTSSVPGEEVVDLAAILGYRCKLRIVGASVFVGPQGETVGSETMILHRTVSNAAVTVVFNDLPTGLPNGLNSQDVGSIISGILALGWTHVYRITLVRSRVFDLESPRRHVVVQGARCIASA